MAGGRPALPSNIRVLRGNPGRRPLNDDEPRPPEVTAENIPDPPTDLSLPAQKYWRDYAVKLSRMRVLTEADLMMLAMLSESTHTYWDAMREVRAKGMIVKVGTGPYAWQRNPYLTEANNAMKQMGLMLSQFGLSPSSRTKLKVEK